LNKVDLPSANPEEVSDDIIDLLGCKLEDIIHASVKLVFVSKIYWPPS
jgi:GTP-binding protein LepA